MIKAYCRSGCQSEFLVSVDVAKIDHGTIIISDTLNPSLIIKYVKAYKSIVSPFDSGKSLGNMNSNSNESRLTMNACDNSEPDQKWVVLLKNFIMKNIGNVNNKINESDNINSNSNYNNNNSI
ncbi:hypothetical protein H8356DRAFT_1082333 [Neocallimastix lanati (nom. inval.)]|nr:hypothetical protein H8356DRAFT_1082333 [Neocallimastix sp. JGI-2020a]